jgi:S-adenosylmethionine hydrolase
VNASRIVTFTTDFGAHDHYVGTMKGVVLGIAPAATLVDICHEVVSFDVMDGALTLGQAYRFFPPGTIHVVVVDPGVGGVRRPIIADTGRHVFVCPDNGVLSCVYLHESKVSVRHIVNDRYFLHPVSNTFHGRDIFAPVAAHIAAGVPIEEFGPEIQDCETLSIPRPQAVGKGQVQGSVLKIDKFGNVVTNITPKDVVEFIGSGNAFQVKVANTIVSDFRTSYAGAESGQLFSIFGSMGYLEVASNQSSAAETLNIAAGDVVELIAE